MGPGAARIQPQGDSCAPLARAPVRRCLRPRPLTHVPFPPGLPLAGGLMLMEAAAAAALRPPLTWAPRPAPPRPVLLLQLRRRAMAEQRRAAGRWEQPEPASWRDAHPPGPPADPGGGGGGGFLDGPRCHALCTARACCQMVQVLLCTLMIVCSSVSYNSVGGYTGLFSLGSVYYYPYGGAYSGFAGADGEKAQRLDAQFQQLKLPPAQAAMAVGGALLAFACLQIGAGLLRLPWRCPAWLIAEAFLDVAVGLGLVPALYFYYRHLHAAYASSPCKERESLYHSKGYSGFGCNLHAAEMAVGFFAGAAIAAFFLAAFLAARAFMTVRKYQAKPTETYNT